MEPQNIETFVSEKIRSGMKKADITEQLVAVGWSEDEADAAYAKALVVSGVPVPHEGSRGLYAKKSSAVEVVLNLFSFILLGIVTTALGTLFFGVIDLFFPDTLDTYYYWSAERARDSIHYAIAALIVGFPLYVLSVRLWFRKFREEEGKVESKLTKWITYLVLLVASVTIVGDLIAILYTFLQGEISIRFFLKALIVLGSAGVIFAFYYLERKKIQYRKEIPRIVFFRFGWAMASVTVVGILLGFVASGTPGQERIRGFDEQRSSDLQSLANCINSYVDEFEKLPEELSDLERSSRLSYCSDTQDPETGEEYEYRVVAPLSLENEVYIGTFELCATFALSSVDVRAVSSEYSKWFSHLAGRSCEMENVSYKQQSTVNTQLVPQSEIPTVKF